MAKRLYNAFVKAGLEKQARTLTETITLPNGDTKFVPRIGRDIVIFDAYLNKESFSSEMLRNARRNLSVFLDRNYFKKSPQAEYPSHLNILRFMKLVENDNQKGIS